MTERKWTPGTWHAVEDDCGSWLVQSISDEWVVKELSWSHNEEGDAHLIAAAPDMYDACEDAFLALLSAREFILKKYGSTNPAREDAINACRAALAKARGEA